MPEVTSSVSAPRRPPGAGSAAGPGARRAPSTGEHAPSVTACPPPRPIPSPPHLPRPPPPGTGGPTTPHSLFPPPSPHPPTPLPLTIGWGSGFFPLDFPLQVQPSPPPPPPKPPPPASPPCPPPPPPPRLSLTTFLRPPPIHEVGGPASQAVGGRGVARPRDNRPPPRAVDRHPGWIGSGADTRACPTAPVSRDEGVPPHHVDPQASTREDVLASIAAAFEEAAPDGWGSRLRRAATSGTCPSTS